MDNGGYNNFNLNNDYNNYNQNIGYQYQNGDYQNYNFNQNSNQNGKKIAIVLLILLVIGLVGYIIYDKVINKNNTICDIKEEYVNNDSVEVVDFYTYKNEGKLKLQIPMLTGNTNNIKELNAKMEKDFLDDYMSNIIYQLNQMHINEYDIDTYLDNLRIWMILQYKKIIINNIVGIKKDFVNLSKSTEKTGNLSDFYFYDIENDKVIDLKEFAEKTNAVILNDYYDKSNNRIEICKTYEDFDKLSTDEISVDFEKNAVRITCKNFK